MVEAVRKSALTRDIGEVGIEMDMTKHCPLLTGIADATIAKLEQERENLRSLIWWALNTDIVTIDALIEQERRVAQAKRKVFEACTNLDRSWENWHRYYNEVNMA